MTLRIYDKEYKVHIKRSTYANNGSLAIQLLEDDGFPFATLTVNIDKLPQGYAYLDTNNHPWAEKFVDDNHLGEYTGLYAQSGFCEYPLYRFYEEEI